MTEIQQAWNPAHQLQLLLSPDTLKHYEKGKIYDAWSQILGIPGDRRSAAMYAIGNIGKLPVATGEFIRTIYPDDHDVYISWVPPVSKVLNQNNLDNGFASVKAQISDDRWGLIRICSQQIRKEYGVVSASIKQQESIKEIYHESLQVIRKIESTDELDPILRAFSLKHLEILERAIVDFMIFGAARSVGTLETSMGLASLKPKELESMKNNSTTETVIDVLAKFVMAISVLQGFEFVLDKATSIIGLISAVNSSD